MAPMIRAGPTPGGSSALLRQVLDQALAGDDEPVPVAQRPWFRPVWDASTPAAVLDAYATVITLASVRTARIFDVVRRASDHAASLGPLAAGLNPDRATDILSIFNDPASTTP